MACFAATTLDTATRLQRYVIQELAANFHLKPFENKYLATLLAVGLGLAVAARLIEIMGGTIEAIPAGDDGATFRILLPVALERAE